MKYIPRYDIRLIRDGRISVDATPIIRTPQDTLPILEAELSELAYERFVALALSTKNHVIAVLPVSQGSLNSSIVHPRELYQRAILSNCASLLLAHNHPSGTQFFRTRTSPSLAGWSKLASFWIFRYLIT